MRCFVERRLPLSIRALAPLTALMLACGAGGNASPGAQGASAAEAPKIAELPDRATAWCGETPCPCVAGSENKHYGKETLQKCKLSAPTVVQGVRCMAAEVAFMPEGSLARCYLSEDQAIGPYTCSAKKVVEFHREGQLKSCYLAKMAQVDGLWCKDGTALEKDGSLHRCRVEQASDVQGFTIPAGDWITLDQGKIYRWEVTGEPQALGELRCAGSMNYLHPDGSLAKCKLANPATVEGREIPAGETVCFDTAGKLADCSTMRFRTV